MYMVLVVIDDPANVDKVLEGLEAGGITGATIIESTGLHRKKKKHIPLRYLYVSPVPEETENLTIFTIVPDRETVKKCQEIIEHVVGDFNNPDTGIFAAWELDQVKGVPSGAKGKGQE